MLFKANCTDSPDHESIKAAVVSVPHTVREAFDATFLPAKTESLAKTRVRHLGDLLGGLGPPPAGLMFSARVPNNPIYTANIKRALPKLSSHVPKMQAKVPNPKGMSCKWSLKSFVCSIVVYYNQLCCILTSLQGESKYKQQVKA